jgi:hypothetical protein
MKKVKMISDVSGMSAYIVIKEKGFLGAEQRSYINTFVCPKCGKLELIAERPDIFN